MKKFRLISIIMMIAVVLFGGILTANAASSVPNSVVSDPIPSRDAVEIDYLGGFKIVYKTTNNGKNFIYCMDIDKTFAGNITFTKTGTADLGFAYILKNRPQTSDKKRDFYVTQLAVWYWEDHLKQNNNNITSETKKYIIYHKDEEGSVSKDIYDLYEGAKRMSENNKQQNGTIKIDTSSVKFTLEDGNYVSNSIPVTLDNIDKVTYSLENAPGGTKLQQNAKGDALRLVVPADKIDKGKQVSIKINAEATYSKATAYYYHYTNDYQNVLYQDPITQTYTVTATATATVVNYPDTYPVLISKTDVTGEKEVAGATLVVKNENGVVVESWVSGTTAKSIILAPGKYTLTETIAPKGYKLSSTTVTFALDEYGIVYTRNEKGMYVVTNKVVMVNELLDMVSIEKRDSSTKEFVSGAKLVIKDSKGKIVQEFTTSNKAYSIELDPGYYTLSEVSAPNGYLLSKEVIYFYLKEDGTLQVKDEYKGEYLDTALITFYNTKEAKQEVNVPSTDKNSTLLVVSGITLLIGGLACAKKTIKEC